MRILHDSEKRWMKIVRIAAISNFIALINPTTEPGIRVAKIGIVFANIILINDSFYTGWRLYIYILKPIAWQKG
jgi:hypothetical protein